MKYIRIFINLLAVALFLALAPAALASTWYVDGVNGNDNNDCKSWKHACQTIGHAISLASSGDTIKVAPATYYENLTISTSLTIVGSDTTTTIVDGGGTNTVFTISIGTGPVVLSKLTIQNGYGYYAGGVTNRGTLTVNRVAIVGSNATLGVGGISGLGPLTINNSTISGNSTGGIYNQAAATINNSTISGNSGAGEGGGIENDIMGTLTINNSTISGNSATYWGGGIENTGTLTINNSTISGNSAAKGGGIMLDGQWGGTVSLQNSIVAKNSGGNCSGTMTSLGYNLSSDNTCNFSGPGDMNNTPAKLGKLGNHGGPTQTIPELKGSPAIDAGNPAGCTDSQGHLLTTDQRGYPRPDKEDNGIGCDMGAYEKQM